MPGTAAAQEALASHNSALHLPLHLFPRMPSVLHSLALTLLCSHAHIAVASAQKIFRIKGKCEVAWMKAEIPMVLSFSSSWLAAMALFFQVVHNVRSHTHNPSTYAMACSGALGFSLVRQKTPRGRRECTLRTCLILCRPPRVSAYGQADARASA